MLDSLISLIAPHECLTCGREGLLLCTDCAAKLPVLPERCYKCYGLSPGAKTCLTCRRTSPLYSVQIATRYDTTARDLIWKLKFAHARAAVQVMQRTMTDRLVFSETAVLAHVPTATGRIRQRGFDQASLLSQTIAKKASLSVVDALGRTGQARQVGANRKERAEHLRAAFWVKKPEAIRGKHVVLVDDVLTTGATLEAAAAVLRKAGAKRVDAIVFAQA